MQSDEEWEQWMTDFRRSTEPTIDAKALVESVRRSRWKQGVTLALELGSTLFAIAVFVVLSVKVPKVWILASLVIPVLSASLVVTLRTRIGTWRAASETVLAFVELEERRRLAELFLFRFGLGLYAVLVFGFAVWLPYFLASGQGRPDLGMPFLLARLLFGVGTFIGVWFYLRFKIAKTQAECSRLKHLRRSLSPGDAPSSP